MPGRAASGAESRCRRCRIAISSSAQRGKYSGIHESTFYRWIGEPKTKLQRELSEGLKKEESAFKRTLLTTIRSAALARNQYWTAAAWLLERKYPDEFGKAERQRDDAKVDAAPRIVLGVVAQPVQEKLPGFDQTAEGRSDG